MSWVEGHVFVNLDSICLLNESKIQTQAQPFYEIGNLTDSHNKWVESGYMD